MQVWKRVAVAALGIASGVLFGRERGAEALATIVVNSSGDAVHACAASGTGTCSLRDAILFANVTAGHDIISFNIAGIGPHLIEPLSALPTLTDTNGVTIDGYTQAGAAANTATGSSTANLRIQVSGIAAGDVNGLRVESSNNVIRGLSITSFTNGAGVDLSSGVGNVVEGSYVGVAPDGSAAGNLTGIRIGSGATASRIGGGAAAQQNIISANDFAGIEIEGPSQAATVIAGNLIGAGRATGATDVGNGGSGILLETVVGIQAGGPGSGNLVAYNGGAGIAVSGAMSYGNRLAENVFFGNDLAIDLGNDGGTANDAGDIDTGPNLNQNFPVLEGAFISTITGNVLVRGSQSSNVLGGQNTIHIFETAEAAGQRGQGRALANALAGAGTGTFAFATTPARPPIALAAGARLTATTTTSDGTSEFSPAITLLANKRPVASAGPNATAAPGAIVTLDGTGSSDQDAEPAALQDGVSYAWSQKSGPLASLSNSKAQSPTFQVTLSGTYVFELVVNDGLDDSLVDSVSITVNDTTVPVATPQTVIAFAGQPKQIRLSATDGPNHSFIFKLVTRPQNGSIVLNENTGVAIYTAVGGFSGNDIFTFTASDGVNTSPPATVTITVAAGLTVTTQTVPAGIVGRSYSAKLAATGGAPAYSWAVSGGALPPGLTLSTAGTISGKPTAAGTFEVTIRARDSVGSTTTVFFTIKVISTLPYRVFGPMVATD